MTDTTTLGFPYMEDGDAMSTVAQQMQDGLEQVDEHLRGGDESWQDADSLMAANFAGLAGYHAGRFRLLPGRRAVRLEAAQTRSSSTHNAGTTIFTLPAGYRPTAATQMVPGLLTNGDVAGFNIGTGGAVSCGINIPSGVSFIVYGDFSLD